MIDGTVESSAVSRANYLRKTGERPKSAAPKQGNAKNFHNEE